LLPFPGEFPHLFSKCSNGNDGQRKDDISNDGQFPALKKGDSHQAEEGKNIFENTGRGAGHRSLNQRHIICDPGNDNAGGCFCEERERKGLQMIVQFLPDIRDNSQTHKIHEVGLTIIEDTFEQVQEDKKDRKEAKHLHTPLEQEVFEMKMNNDMIDEGWNSK